MATERCNQFVRGLISLVNHSLILFHFEQLNQGIKKFKIEQIQPLVFIMSQSSDSEWITHLIYETYNSVAFNPHALMDNIFDLRD